LGNITIRNVWLKSLLIKIKARYSQESFQRSRSKNMYPAKTLQRDITI
jgi:hypothetical protein